jgi:hypothetical protein
MTNRDPGAHGPAERGWSAGTIAAVAIGVIVVLAAISYGIDNPPSSTASGPSATDGHASGGSIRARSPATGSNSR